MELLFLLAIGHFLCDYPLQGDFIAKYKARYVDGLYNPLWKHVLTAHAFIHAGPVVLLTGSVWAGLFMVVTHFCIDYSKCEGKISFNTDQLLHLSVIAIIWLFV